MIENAKWIGRKAGEIQGFGGNPLENIKDKKDEINVPRASLLLRRAFEVKKPVKKAVIEVCGLGLYILKINGKRATDAILAPLQTNYQERVLYDEIDVTALLKSEKNVILIELGTGQYASPKKRWDWRMCWYGNVRAAAVLEIEYIDGEKEYIMTDDSFKMHDGAVVESCIYDGEKYDARLEIDGVNDTEFDDGVWENAVLVECPSKSLVKNTFPPIRVCGAYEACGVKKVKEGLLYDFGKNRAARVSIKVSGKRGESVAIRHCERLLPDGEPDYRTNNGADTTDVYTLKGEGVEIYAAEFTFHGFRYAVLIPSSDEIKIHSAVQEHIHSDVEVTGTFECDNEDINKIHEGCTLTFLNAYIGLPIDCPQRDERMGWLGDAHVTAEAGMYNFNMLEFYRKWLTDIRLDTAPDGEVPHIAPWPQRREPSPVDWSAGYPIIAVAAYKMYGDKTIIAEHYDSFKNYVAYLKEISDDYVLPQGRYGDWSSSLEGFTRGEPYYDNTMFFYYVLLLTRECAKIMESDDDVRKFDGMMQKMRERCISLYYDKENKSFGDGTQFSNGFALLLGLVPDEDMQQVFNTLLQSIKDANGHLIGGIFGTQYVMDMLRKFDRGDVAVDIMLKKEYPSWLDMFSRSTTVTECWRGDIGSQNHCMLGSVDAQLYKLLGGINIDMSKEIPVTIKPYVTDKCTWVKTSEKTIKGEIVSNWTRRDGEIEINVTIPDGLNAHFEVSKLNKTANMYLNGKAFDGSAKLNAGENTVLIKE